MFSTLELNTDPIVPCPRHNEKALFLLYNQLESEKERRVQSVAEDGAEA
jgi:hypothetical protein